MILICFTKFVKGWQRERERGRERERERERERVLAMNICVADKDIIAKFYC